MTKSTLLLFLSADGLYAQHLLAGKIATQRDFPDTPDGHADFAEFMQAVACPTYLLTDLIEEDFRQESVPHLLGSSRTALLKRKLDQYYRSTPFHQAKLLQRQKTGRRDDDMLFSALTNPSNITPWLDVIQAQKTPLVGIFSVPQISAPLVKDHSSKHLLLVSQEKTAGLRQTYFSDHRLHISRLTPINTGTFTEAVVYELARTHQYLQSLSLLPTGQVLDVRILCHQDDRAELEAQLPDSTDIRYDFVDLAAIGQKLKIQAEFADSDATQIFLHQLVVNPPKTHYANSDHTHYYTLWKLRRILTWASAPILVISLLWSGAIFWESREDASQASSIKMATQRIQENADQIIRTFPNTNNISASDMKAVVSTMRNLRDYNDSPETVLGPIGMALSEYEQVKLENIDWRFDSAEPVIANTNTLVPAQVITLSAHLVSFNHDYRAALNYLERFTKSLMERGFQVTILSKPLDVSPTGNIEDQRKMQSKALKFSLKLSRRPPT